jgi:hypothetical protein
VVVVVVVRVAGIALFAAACGRIGFDTGDEEIPDPGVAAAYGSILHEDGPIAYFRFSEPSGPDAISEVGTARGTYQGDFTFGTQGAVGDDSVTYDGLTTSIDFGDQFRFAGNAPYTFEVWIRPRAIDNHTLFILDRYGMGDGYNLYIGDDYTLFSRQMADTEFGYVDTSKAPALDRWTFLAVTYDGTNARLFENGVLASSNTGGDAARPIADVAGTLVVGDHVPSQFFKFDGRIDELAIYAYELDPGRIQAHYDTAR